jgi:DNA-binding HxlR family transcriptional regulator/putative sterol carrier protein
MPEHRYQQFCALARALDVVGDRWNLLIVRELVPGPRRFTDLIDGLPGVSRKLLTERLRALELDGIITRQELPPPAARQVYELTDDGRDLAGAMAPLIAWGARRIGEREPTDSFRARWVAVPMAALADREAAKDVRETYQYLVGGSAFYFTIDHGEISLRDGRAQDPAVTWTTDEETWADMASGKITAESAAATGALTVAGDPQAATRLRNIFSRTKMLAQAQATMHGDPGSKA